MKKLIISIVCLFCFFLSASAIEMNEHFDFITQNNDQRSADLDQKSNIDINLVRGFRFPRMPKKGISKSPPKGSHNINQRESNREKHENADGRRQREQKKAEEKRENSKKKN